MDMARRITGSLGHVVDKDRIKESEGDLRFCIAIDPWQQMVTKLIILGLVGKEIEVSIQFETQRINQHNKRNSQSSSIISSPLWRGLHSTENSLNQNLKFNLTQTFYKDALKQEAQPKP